MKFSAATSSSTALANLALDATTTTTIQGALYISKAVYYGGPADGSRKVVLTIAAGAGTSMTTGSACAAADFTAAGAGASIAAGSTCTQNSATQVTLFLAATSALAAGGFFMHSEFCPPLYAS